MDIILNRNKKEQPTKCDLKDKLFHQAQETFPITPFYNNFFVTMKLKATKVFLLHSLLVVKTIACLTTINFLCILLRCAHKNDDTEWPQRIFEHLHCTLSKLSSDIRRPRLCLRFVWLP